MLICACCGSAQLNLDLVPTLTPKRLAIGQLEQDSPLKRDTAFNKMDITIWAMLKKRKKYQLVNYIGN